MRGIRIKKAISTLLEMFSVNMINEPNEDRWYDEANQCIYIHNNKDVDIDDIMNSVFKFFEEHNPLGFYILMSTHEEDDSLSYIKFIKNGQRSSN